MVQDNPAERLLQILEEGKKIQNHTNCRDTWSKLLEISNKDEALLMSRLGKVMTLPNEIIGELKKIDGTDKSTYQHWVNCVNSGFMQQNLNENWQTFIGKIDGHTIPYLKISNQLLAAHIKSKAISKSGLDKIKEKIQDLIKFIRESNETLDPNVQSFLLESLGSIINRINEYKISGINPILKEIDSTLGHAVSDLEFRKNLKDTDIGNKVWSVLVDISVLVTIAGAPKLTMDATKLLTN